MSRAREFADLAGSADAGGLTGRNLLINGAMQVAQRGTSLSMAHDGTDDSYLIDRFFFAIVGNHGELDGTYAQVDDHPLSTNGKSLKWTTGTAEAAYAANEYVYLTQKIEAQNLQHLNYGNSNAQSVTLSFYVKSSITGTFAVGFYKEDSTTRIFNQTYTINSANTWEKKSITFAGDTAGGGIVNDNGAGLWTTWHLAAGSGATGGGSVGAWKNYGGLTDWADGQATNAVTTTASATWQITDCQLEVGEQATPFEHRSFGDELRRCQRYYEHSYPYGTAAGAANGGVGAMHLHAGASRPSIYAFVTTRYTVQKRAAATVTIYSYGGTSGQMSNGDSGGNIGAVDVIQNGATSFLVRNNSGSTMSEQPIIFHYRGDAEL